MWKICSVDSIVVEKSNLNEIERSRAAIYSNVYEFLAMSMGMSIFNYHMCVKSILNFQISSNLGGKRRRQQRLFVRFQFSCVLSQMKQFNILESAETRKSVGEHTLNRTKRRIRRSPLSVCCQAATC